MEKLTIVVRHTSVCTEPEMPLLILKHATNAVARKPIVSREGLEGTAIKATKTTQGSDPQVAMAVFQKICDPVVDQSIFNPIKFEAIFGMPARQAPVAN